MKILLDFDSTICNTGKAMFDFYRELTNDYSTEYSEDKVTWNMSNLIKFSQEETDNMFIQEEFFKHLQLYQNVYEILNKLKQDGHYLHIVTCHNPLGAEYKLRWIKNNLPMIDEVTIIPIEHGLVKFDKSSVIGDILLDDSISALKTSKVRYKFCYGKYQWNKSWSSKRVMSWDDFYLKVCELVKLNTCEICKSDSFVQYDKTTNKYLCSKHRSQVKRKGKILERTLKDSNKIILYKDYAEILLYNINGEEVARTKIDLEDIDICSKYKWHLNGDGYAANNSTKLHQIILGSWHDHINKDRLDNRKSNLRPCTQQENNRNVGISKNNTSGTIGVGWDKKRNKWIAQIVVDYKNINLGLYDDFDQAVKIRLLAEKKYFKEFAPQIHLYDQYGCKDINLDDFLLEIKLSKNIIGVSFDKARNKWVGFLNFNKKTIRKRFLTKDDAIKYRLQLEKEYFGESAPQKHLFQEYGIMEGDNENENSCM